MIFVIFKFAFVAFDFRLEFALCAVRCCNLIAQRKQGIESCDRIVNRIRRHIADLLQAILIFALHPVFEIRIFQRLVKIGRACIEQIERRRILHILLCGIEKLLHDILAIFLPEKLIEGVGAHIVFAVDLLHQRAACLGKIRIVIGEFALLIDRIGLCGSVFHVIELVHQSGRNGDRAAVFHIVHDLPL